MLLLTACGGAALLSLGLAGALIALALYSAAAPGSSAAGGLPILDAALIASALTLIAILLLPACYYSLQMLRGRPPAKGIQPLIRAWQVVLLIAVWGTGVVLAAAFYGRPLLKWFTPPLYLLSIGLPVYCFARLATGGLPPASRARRWGVFGIGMITGPTLAILAEGTVAVLALVAAGVYIALNQETAAPLRQLASQLQAANDTQELFRAASPYLNSPVLWLGALTFLSVLTPLIEEPVKTIGVWLVAGRIRSVGEGFALGALNGAGFGLVESLLVSATPDANWGMTLGVRAASSMMHTFTASLMGWGIASARLNRKTWHALAAFAAALLIHGLWNGAAVSMVLAALRLVPAMPDLGAVNPLDVVLMLGAILVLAAMVSLLPIVLGLINWQLRRAPEAMPPAPAGEAGQSG
jgi:hypothetical protein